MAKKSAGGFVMAEEIRGLLRDNRSMTSGEVIAALKEKFPRESINESSASVAFSNARKKLNIKPGKRRRSGKRRVVRKRVPTAAPRVDFAALQAAAKFVADMGNADKAIEAVKQVRSLQIK